MATIVGSASIRIFPNTTGFNTALQSQLKGANTAIQNSLGKGGAGGAITNLRSNLQGLSEDLGRSSQRMINAGEGMTYALTRPLVGLAKQILETSTEYDKFLRTASAVSATYTGNAPEQLAAFNAEATGTYEALSKKALEFSRSTSYSMNEVASAFVEVSRAGIQGEEKISGIFKTIANVAMVEGEDITKITEGMIKVFTGFGGSFENFGPEVRGIFGEVRADTADLSAEFEKMGDVLALVSARTTTNISDLVNAFRYAGPVAAAVGLSFEETATGLGLLAQAGFDATVGGTALRGIITRLIIPTQVNQEVFDKLGVTVNDVAREIEGEGDTVEEITAIHKKFGLEVLDASGKMKPLTEILKYLDEQGITTAEAMKLFGQRAGPGLLALIGQSPELLDTMTQEMQNAGGATQAMADILKGSWDFQFKQFRNSLVELANAIAKSGLMDFVIGMTQGLTDFLRHMSDTSPETFRFALAIGGLVAAVGPLNIILGLLGKAWDNALLKPMIMLTNPISAVLLLLGLAAAAIGLLYAKSEPLRQALAKLGQVISTGLAPILERVGAWFGGAVEGANSLAESLGDKLAVSVENLSTWLTQLFASDEFKKFVDDMFTGAENVGRVIREDVLPAIQEFAGVVVDAFRNTILPIMQEAWAFVNDHLAPIFGVVLVWAFAILREAAGFAADGIRLLSEEGNPVVSFITDNFIPVLASLTAGFVALKLGAAAAAGAQGIGMVAMAFPKLAGLTAAITGVGSAFSSLWGILTGGHAILSIGHIVLTSTAFVAAAVAAAVLSVGILIKTIYDRSLPFVNAISAGFEQIKLIGEGLAQALSGVWDIIAGIFTGDGQRILDGFGAFFQGLISKAVGGMAGLLAEVARGLSAFVDTILEAFGNIPVIGPLFDAMRSQFAGVMGVLGGVFDIVKGILSLDLDKIIQGFSNIGSAISGAFSGIMGAGGDIVSGIMSGLGNIGGVIGEALGGIVEGAETYVPIIGRGLLDAVGAAFSWIFNELPNSIGQSMDMLPSIITTLGENLAAGIRRLPGFFSELPAILGEAFMNAIRGIGGFLGNIWDIISEALFGGGGEGGGSGEVVAGAIVPDESQQKGIADRIGEFLAGAFRSAVDWLIGAVPGFFTEFIPSFATFILNLPGEVISRVGNIGGLLVEMFEDFAPGLIEFFKALPGRLGDIAGAIAGAFGNVGSALWDTFRPMLDDLTGRLLEALGFMVLAAPKALLGIGAVLLGALVVAFRYLRDNGANLIRGAFDFILNIPSMILSMLGNLGSWLLENVFVPAWDFLALNFPIGLEVIINFFRGLPGLIVSAIGALGTWLWDNVFTPAWSFIATNFPLGVEVIVNFFRELPGRFISAIGDFGSRIWNEAILPAFNFVVVNFPLGAEAIVNFFRELPGRLISAIGDFGSRLWNEAFLPAFNFLITNVPIWIDRVVEFFRGLPGQVLSALGSAIGIAGDFARTLGNAVIDFVNGNIINNLNSISIELPFAGRVDFPDIAHIPRLHDGGIVGEAAATPGLASNEVLTVLQVGEGVLPLDAMNRLGEEAFNALMAGNLGHIVLPVDVVLTAQILNSEGALAVFHAMVASMIMLIESLYAAINNGARVASEQFASAVFSMDNSFSVMQSNIAIGSLLIISSIGSIITTLERIPGIMSAVGQAIASGFRDPIAFIGASVWPPFASMLNSASSSFGLEGNIPGSFTVPVYHSGGIVGEGGAGTYSGGGLSNDELFALLQQGEGVMSQEMMANLTKDQMAEFKRGNPMWFAVGGPYESGKSYVSSNKDKVGESVKEHDLDAMKATYDNSVVPMLNALKEQFQGNIAAGVGASAIEHVANGAFEWVRGGNEAVAEEMRSRMSTVGLPPGFNLEGAVPEGFDIGHWRSFLGANKRPGSYPLLMSYLQAAGVPYLVNSTFRPGGTSYHAQSRAVDFGAPNDSNYDSPGLLRINRALAPMLGVLQELIYSGPGGVSDKAYDGATMAAHHNHVHAALANGGYVQDMLYAMIGEAGPEVVIPLSDPGRALDIALASDLFSVLAAGQRSRLGASGIDLPAPSGAQTALRSVPTNQSVPSGNFDGGFLGGGPGNTYNIYGIDEAHVRTTIRNQDEAVQRKRN